ncbi:Bgt-1998, partial [Blumeria graminis f. sp. tritici]
ISISNKAPAPSRSGGKRGAKKSAPEETEEPLLVDSEDEEDDGLPDNEESASKLLNEYLKSVGGKDLILADWAEKKALAESSKKGKKRGRSSPSSVNNSIKRTRKSIKHPASTSPPASAIAAKFEPPSGSWEEEVIAIDACEGTQGNVIVYLTWKGGHKSQHPLAQIYKRCPQKMLKFYEDHL